MGAIGPLLPCSQRTAPQCHRVEFRLSMQRRNFAFAIAASLGLLSHLPAHAKSANTVAAVSPPSAALSPVALMARCQMLEAHAKGRLGLFILHTGTGKHFGYREDERFMMLSSFKLLASALVLHRVDIKKERLNRRITFPASAVLAGSPVTQKHAGSKRGMTLAQLCEATITTSDNTAANLILSSYGGPAALTDFIHHTGDTVTRLDRNEPSLNRAASNPLLDTTSPRAMAQTLQALLLGNALSTKSRQQLKQWLLANTTGAQRIRAGVPKTWRVGDKTGTNANSANDVAILLPPRGAPLIVSAYLADSSADAATKNASLAAVGALAHTLSQAPSLAS